jgi:serine/threonine-protein kinase
MPLSTGDKLGPYEILAPLGAGGMGEVYRALDTRLRRDVAIKVSADRFSERFETEARAIASLNHPNVCTLYDVGPNYLVMELVEGRTLAERIAQGAIPPDETLAIAKQIADALEAAHETGITHRDLKPGNIKIKPDGMVKVLDFGLAKMGGTPTTHSDTSPTLTVGPTQAGVILGTAAYMAPEQARGKDVDRRADIWAFGVVLYEMLTGQRLFQGDDATETLASVIKDEPKWERLPPQVRRLVRSCLKKDPKQRLQAIGDWSLLLEEQAPPPKARDAKAPWIMAGALAIALGIALWAPWRSGRPLDRPLVRLDVDLGADVSLPAGVESGLAISPDGTQLVFASGSPSKLFTRRLDQSKATELPGTQGASSAFFSPDGRWVGFYANGKVSKMSVEGGAIVPLADTNNFLGAGWSEDGIFLVIGNPHEGLVRVSAEGGPQETLAERGGEEIALCFPQVLPGGKAVLFYALPTLEPDKATVEVLTLADRHRKTVVRGGASPRYVATAKGAGYLIYANQATLFAVPFDPDKLETRGTAEPILDEVAYEKYTGASHWDVSPAPSGHGTVVYRKSSGGPPEMATLQWVDATGGNEPLAAEPGAYLSVNLSPDGKRAALMVGEAATADLWVYDLQRDAMTRLTFGGSNRFPCWSPDGQFLVYAAAGKGIFQVRADGAGPPQILMPGKDIKVPGSFTPDGKRLAFHDFGGGKAQIWTVPLEIRNGLLKAGEPEQFLKTSFTEQDPAFSPDGRWLAYSSTESGRNEVYVRAFPPPASGQGGKWQISNNGGDRPFWLRQGHELVYGSGSGLMAVRYTVSGDTFVVDKPRMWFEKLGKIRDGDIAPDGKRMLVLRPVVSVEPPKQEHTVVFLENFFDELRRKVPAGK